MPTKEGIELLKKIEKNTANIDKLLASGISKMASELNIPKVDISAPPRAPEMIEDIEVIKTRVMQDTIATYRKLKDKSISPADKKAYISNQIIALDELRNHKMCSTADRIMLNQAIAGLKRIA